MRTSESIDKIIPALLKAQGNFPPIVKTKTARIKGDKADYEFSYAPLDAILHAVRPHLFAEGLTVMQGVEGFNLVTTLFHVSGQFISHWSEMPHAYPSPRAFGSELTFRRRYSVTAVLGLASEDDDDGQHAERELQRKAKADKTGVTAPDAASGAAIKRQSFDAMDPKQQEFLRQKAANVIGLLDEKRDDDAYGYLINQKLDVEEQLAISSLFDPKQRAALKRAGDRAAQERKAAEVK